MKTVVRLKILSDELLPEAISEKLGLSPDLSWHKGVPDGKTTPNMLKWSGWILNSGAPEDVPLEKQIRTLLTKLEPRAHQLRAISALETVNISCVIYSDTAPPLYFEKEVIGVVASLGANFDIDLYPSSDAVEPVEDILVVERKDTPGTSGEPSHSKSKRQVM